MVLVDIYFHFGGDWCTDPEVKYSSHELHKWPGYESDHLSYIDLVDEYISALGFVGVQQLIVSGPSGKYFEIVEDEGIRALLGLINDDYTAIDIFAVEENELGVDVPSLVNHNDTFFGELDNEGAATDCSIYDSDFFSDSDASDYDWEKLESLAVQKNRQMSEKLSEYKEIEKNQTFSNIPEARKYMKFYALANSYGLELMKSDRTRLRYVCQVGCPFVCLISRDGRHGGVRVKTLEQKHDCEPVFDNPTVDSSTLALYFKKKIQEEPKYTVSQMQKDLKAEFNMNVHESKCKRAKRKILMTLEGSFVDDYRKLEGYAKELRDSNPGSDVIVNISKDALAEGNRRFLRMYICFKALKMGFKDGLRPFVGMDGTFLRGRATGILLVVVGQDSMNHFYPLAWAIVDKETKATWTWFLDLLGQSLELNNGEGYTFISDMQKGLTEAMKNVLPAAHHRYCVKHIEHNWCKTWKEDIFKKYLWWSAWSTYPEDFKDQLSKLGGIEKLAAEQLLEYLVQSWVRAYFDTVCKNQAVDNNMTESFNSWILEARHKSVIKMLEEIRTKVMKLLWSHEQEVRSWDTGYSPVAIKLYKQYLRIAQSCEVVFNGDDGFEVTQGNDQHTVNMAMKRCTCRGWDLSGIPCPHVIKCLQYMKVNPLVEMHWYYSREAHLLAYKHKLQPVRGEKFWTIDPAKAMDPPKLVNQAGRPRVKRTREKDEAINRQGAWAADRHGRQMTCSTCGEPNHNARGCLKISKGKQAAKTYKQRKASKRKASHVSEPGNSAPNTSQPAQSSSKISKGKSVMCERQPTSPPPSSYMSEEDIALSAPIPSQVAQSSQASELRFMPTPTVNNQMPSCFQDPMSDDETDLGVGMRPQQFSETTKLFNKEKPPQASGTRVINFIGDASGLSQPTDLPYSPKRLRWNGRAALTTEQLGEKVAKLKARKGNGKAQV